MKGFEAYRLAHAVWLHFNTDTYDLFKYKGKTKVTMDKFKTEPNRWVYEWLETQDFPFLLYLNAKQYDFERFAPKTHLKAFTSLVKRFPHKADAHIGTFLESDLRALKSFVERGSATSHTYPIPYQAYVKGLIQIETLILLDAYIEPVLQSHLSSDPIAWPEFLRKCDRVKPFVFNLLDGEAYRQTLENETRK